MKLPAFCHQGYIAAEPSELMPLAHVLTFDDGVTKPDDVFSEPIANKKSLDTRTPWAVVMGGTVNVTYCQVPVVLNSVTYEIEDEIYV